MTTATPTTRTIVKDGKKKFVWVLQVEVDEDWVSEGFRLNNDVAQNMLDAMLPWANSDEVKATVIEAPDPLELSEIESVDAIFT